MILRRLGVIERQLAILVNSSLPTEDTLNAYREQIKVLTEDFRIERGWLLNWRECVWNITGEKENFGPKRIISATHPSYLLSPGLRNAITGPKIMRMTLCNFE